MTAEFYHVVTDTRTPYRVYGAQQDNTTMSVPSRSNAGVITTQEWYPIGGGESGYIAVRPDNHNIVFAGSYGGNLARYDHSTGFLKAINVWLPLRVAHVHVVQLTRPPRRHRTESVLLDRAG
jgi:hypothetical protein